MFRLLMTPPLGQIREIAQSSDPETLVEGGSMLQAKYPSQHYFVCNENGFIIWPSGSKGTHISLLQFKQKDILNNLKNRHGEQRAFAESLTSEE